ncbi:MAG: ribonuclease III domain-containing protein [Oscillospiraceae bacterium]|nr:ribonuclease III domain-containing protein [Oscillospiraceae bacterium]
MERLFQQPCDPKQLSPLTLAYVGDSVFELFVRERLVCHGNCPVHQLHERSVAQVRCDAQAKSMEKLMGLLTEEELAVFKRGRNAKTSVPKHASSADYHTATGFEALFGYLYLSGRIDRLRQFFQVICPETE